MRTSVDVQSRVLGSPPERRVRALMTRVARATDVLAFPAGPPKPPPSLGSRGTSRRRRTAGAGGDFLGDVVIAVPYAAREARRRGTPTAREVDRLLVHGFLHLCGYDHETDGGEMDALEAKLRQRLGLGRAA